MWLRHNPAAIGLTMDSAGWVAVDELLRQARAHGRGFSRAALDEVVAGNNKQRFEFDGAGTRIRARQGHSVEVELGYPAAEPPALLYHGTAQAQVAAILHEGVRPIAGTRCTCPWTWTRPGTSAGGTGNRSSWTSTRRPCTPPGTSSRSRGTESGWSRRYRRNSSGCRRRRAELGRAEQRQRQGAADRIAARPAGAARSEGRRGGGRHEGGAERSEVKRAQARATWPNRAYRRSAARSPRASPVSR